MTTVRGSSWGLRTSSRRAPPERILGHHALIIPHLVGHGQATEGHCGRRTVRLDLQEPEHHHELAYVLGGVPRGALQVVVHGHVAIIDARLAGEVGRTTGAIPPRVESGEYGGPTAQELPLA